MKNLKLVLRNIKAYPLLRYGISTYLFLSILTISGLLYHDFYVGNLLKETLMENQKLIESISVINEKTNQHYFVAKSDLIKPLSEKQKQEYEQFLEKYFEHQSFYLNFWLSLLAIVLGVFSIIIPICFTKFLEDKRKDINRAIEECNKNEQQCQKQRLEVADLAKEVKANSMLYDARQYAIIKDMDKAFSLVNDSISIKKTSSNLSFRAHFYLHQKNFRAAINDLEESLKIDEINDTLINLSSAYMEIGNIQKAMSYIEASIKKDPNLFINYYNLTEGYIRLRDSQQALISLREFVKRNKNPFINIIDKDNWKKWISEMPQDNNTKELLKIINNLEIKATKEVYE